MSPSPVNASPGHADDNGVIARGCIFCGGTPLTREHIFSREWLRRVMPSEEPFVHALRRTGGDDDEFEKWWTKREADLVVVCTCAPCNNGWMNTVDRDVERLLNPMAKGEALDLARFSDQALVATWVCKTAIIADHFQQRPFVPDEDRRYLHEVRQPPPGWWIWVAATQPAPYGYEAAADARTLEGAGAGGYSSTLIVNHLIAQALVPPQRTVAYLDRSENRDLFLRVWPLSYETVSWPPPELMPREAIPDFLKAFA